MNEISFPFLNNTISNSILFYSIDTNETYSYKKFADVASIAIDYLMDLGVKKDDYVIFAASNSIELYSMWLACFKVGANIVLLDPSYDNKTFTQIINKIRPKFFFSDRKEINGLKRINENFLSNRKFNSEKSFEKVYNIQIISFTSGTESYPKGVMRNLNDFIKNSQKFVEALNVKNNRTLMTFFPGFYLGGFYNAFILPLVNYWSSAFVSSFSPRHVLDFWKIIKKHNVGIIWLVPTIINMINMIAERDEGYRMKTIKDKRIIVLSGTAPLLKKTRESFKNFFGTNILSNYALSETLFISTQTPESDDFSEGRLLKNVEINIDATGEVSVRTDSLLEKYIIIDSPDKYFKKEQFFPTGDIGVKKQGRVFIYDRKKDLIIKGGKNISPSYIESKISMNGLDEIAIIGFQNELSDECIVCFYVAQNNLEIKLRDFCNKFLSGELRPRAYLKIESLPKTNSGKVKKSILKEMLERNNFRC